MPGDGGWGALLIVAALGAFHGANPAMGWLFAVALGCQEQRRVVMWRALVALGLGHALAIAAAIGAGSVALDLIPGGALRVGLAASLVALGTLRLLRSRHPRVGGSMRSGFAGLLSWSFLIASAHGAGLMVLPFVVGAPSDAAAHVAHQVLPAASGAPIAGAVLVAAHTAAYALATAGLAWLVYERLGVGLLRRAWINVDTIWAFALMATGAAAFFTL